MMIRAENSSVVWSMLYVDLRWEENTGGKTFAERQDLLLACA